MSGQREYRGHKVYVWPTGTRVRAYIATAEIFDKVVTTGRVTGEGAKDEALRRLEAKVDQVLSKKEAATA